MVGRPEGLGQNVIMVGGCGKTALHVLPHKRNWQEIQEGARASHIPKYTPPLAYFLQRLHLLPFIIIQYAIIT